jgi:DNA-binding XRE family transcriptional regulator
MNPGEVQSVRNERLCFTLAGGIAYAEVKPVNMKTCTKCKEPKPLDQFSKNRCAKDGKASHCKACAKAHRDTYTPEYKAYQSMRARCNFGRTDHKTYYDKGVKVCERWSGKDGYKHFLADMGPKPTPRHQIDRIDSEGDYEPGNCRWVTALQNIRKKDCLKMSLEKARQAREWLLLGATQQDVADSFGVNRATIGAIARNETWQEAGSFPIENSRGFRKDKFVPQKFGENPTEQSEEG